MRYYDILYLAPFVILFISIVYGIIFGIVGMFPNLFIRALLIFGTSYVHPFGFNWMKMEVTLIDSFINSHESSYFALLLSLAFFSHTYKNKKLVYLPFALLLFGYSFYPHSVDSEQPIKMYIQKPNLDQKIKWKSAHKDDIIKQNFDEIKKAIESGYKIILLHESAFPLYLNQDKYLLQKLKSISKEITIITGALSLKDGHTYNSSYFFKDGKLEVANKVVLVPFGEAIPLPNWAKKIINNLFFNGADDYKTDSRPTDFNVNNVKIRNAICYEATSKELYENNPKHMVVLSNNAWFTPSIEPTLQNMLLRLFSQRYGTVIYHSANIDKSGVIIPK